MPQDVAEAGLELPEQTFGSPTGWMCLVAALRLLQAQAIPPVPAGLQRRGPRRSLHCRGSPKRGNKPQVSSAQDFQSLGQLSRSPALLQHSERNRPSIARAPVVPPHSPGLCLIRIRLPVASILEDGLRNTGSRACSSRLRLGPIIFILLIRKDFNFTLFSKHFFFLSFFPEYSVSTRLGVPENASDLKDLHRFVFFNCFLTFPQTFS